LIIGKKGENIRFLQNITRAHIQVQPEGCGLSGGGTYFQITTFRLPDCPYETDPFSFIVSGSFPGDQNGSFAPPNTRRVCIRCVLHFTMPGTLFYRSWRLFVHTSRYT
jgi:hypothetical protein